MLTKTKSRSLSGKHLKTTLLAFALLFSVNTLMAQEAYEYAVVTAQQRVIVICVNGKSFEEIKVPKEESQHLFFDVNPALREINKLVEEDWEVFDTGSIGSSTSYVFYLRRKL